MANGPSGPVQTQVPIIAQIIIRLDANNQISVASTLNDRTMIYGMLEVARDAIYELFKANENRVQPAQSFPGMKV